MSKQYPLESYVRHARVYGTELVYYTAERDHMAADELLKLAAELRAIDPRHRLTDPEILRLVQRIGHGRTLERALERAGVTRAILRRVLQRAASSDRQEDAA